MICETCKNWADTNMFERILTDHHEHCPYKPDTVMSLVKLLEKVFLSENGESLTKDNYSKLKTVVDCYNGYVSSNVGTKEGDICKKKVAFISCPYRSNTVRGIVENIRLAEACALKWWKSGYAVICPAMNTALFDGAAEDEVWLSGYLEILKRCDVIVMVGDWRNSSGAMVEYKLALKLGKEIIYDLEIGELIC